MGVVNGGNFGGGFGYSLENERKMGESKGNIFY